MKEIWLVAAATLLLLSILLSKITNRLGVPSLLVFLGIGMLAGSDGIGGIYFDNSSLAQSMGALALCFILFSGGMDTSWKEIRPILGRGVLLATLGVLVTTALVGLFAVRFLRFSWLEGLLLGATISSTDAAAVFSLLRGRNIHLTGHVKPLIELESGSNDPMAVFLTVGILSLIQTPGKSMFSLVPSFLLQMILGACFGYLGGRCLRGLINRLDLEFEGLYPVLTIAFVLLLYGGLHLIGGNGFLGVYIAGIVLGNSNFLRKKTLVLFHDGIAWLMQIVMFLILGLFVFPRDFGAVAVGGLALSLFLVFVARPLAVYLCLIRSEFNFREKAIIAWTGLRGAVPIVLAIYPVLAGHHKARLIFHLVFFVVLTSVLLQGTTIPLLARFLKVSKQLKPKYRYAPPYHTDNPIKSELIEVTIPKKSLLLGQSLVDISHSTNVFVVLIRRQGDVIVPRGSTKLQSDDGLLLLGKPEEVESFCELLEK